MVYDVAVAIDENFQQHCGVMLASLFENNKNKSFRIHLLSESSAKNLEPLHKLVVQDYSQQLNHIKIDPRRISTFKVSDHISLATYYRLLIPELIETSLDKLLFLDADIVINGDINTLYQTDLRDHYIAAVEDATATRMHLPEKDRKGTPYFNAGVMLLNLPILRDYKVAERCMEYINRYPGVITFWDQDALNAIIGDEWLRLHPKYNYQGQLFMHELRSFNWSEQELQEAHASPIIIHYSAPSKPWHYLSYHPFTQLYYQYLEKTPWRGYTPHKTPANVIRKKIRPYLRKVGVNKVFGKHLY